MSHQHFPQRRPPLEVRDRGTRAVRGCLVQILYYYYHLATERLAVLFEVCQSLKVIKESWLKFVLVPQFRDVVKTQFGSCTYLSLEGDETVVWTAYSQAEE